MTGPNWRVWSDPGHYATTIPAADAERWYRRYPHRLWGSLTEGRFALIPDSAEWMRICLAREDQAGIPDDGPLDGDWPVPEHPPVPRETTKATEP